MVLVYAPKGSSSAGIRKLHELRVSCSDVMEMETSVRSHLTTLVQVISTIIMGGTFAVDHFTMVRAESPSVKEAQLVLGNPSLPTCPTSNCPAPPFPPVLSTQFIHGATSKQASQAEWLSNIGLFVKTGSPDGQKVAQYVGVMQQEGAGTAWALNTDSVRNAGPGSENSFGGFEGSGKPGKPGAIGERNGSIGYELDFTNWDANSTPGRGAFTVGQYVHAQGSYASLAAIYFDAHMARSNSNAGWTNGIMFNGDRVVADNTFFDGTNSVSSLTVSGNHQAGLNTIFANVDIHAVLMRAGQTACFNSLSNCATWRDGRLTYSNKKGEVVFSIDENGNAYLAGHVYSR